MKNEPSTQSLNKHHKRRSITASFGYTIILIASTLLFYTFLHAPFTKTTDHITESDIQITLNTVTPELNPHTLFIPSLQISAPIRESKEETETAFQEALQQGVVHYPNTAQPGEIGNMYIFGHSSDYKWSKGHYKTIFAKLPEIIPMSPIYISNADGDVFTYVVQETRIVEANNFSVLAQGNQKQLTLQTSYPVGTARQRFLVIATLSE